MDRDLTRALHFISLTNEQRLALVRRRDPEMDWFVTHVDELAPKLRKLGWIEYVDFDRKAGTIVVTRGEGDVRSLTVTPLGKKQLNAAVAN